MAKQEKRCSKHYKPMKRSLEACETGPVRFPSPNPNQIWTCEDCEGEKKEKLFKSESNN